MTSLLASTGNFQNSLFWAVFIGWIMSVVLHEFAHGIVAYWGGDYTIKERGGLTLNPLQYVDPVMSILLPAIFMLIGGVPLPGGVTYVNRDLLRNKAWQTAVSLAGPLMNILLFVAGAIALHPKVGWLPTSELADGWSNAQRLVATLTVLQIFAALLNLIPIPPLDGFNAISPFLKSQTREKLTTPPLSTWLFIIFFVLLTSTALMGRLMLLVQDAFSVLGFDDSRIILIRRVFVDTLFGN
jgi:Zn-dependent protease